MEDHADGCGGNGRSAPVQRLACIFPPGVSMARTRKKLGQILLRWGVIDENQIEETLKVAQGSNKRFGQVLVELGHATEDDVAKALASQYGLEFIDLDSSDAIKAADLELMPIDIVKKYLVLPLEKKDNRLKVLIHDPMDLELLDLLRFRMNCEIDTAIGARSKIKDFIDTLLSETQESIDETVRQLSIDTGDIETASGEDAPDVETAEAPIVRLVHKIITEAVNGRASDIHIEPMTNRVRLRYRVDGVCHERDNIPKRMQNSIISRIKILSGMKIEERRVPQDGRIKMRVGKQLIDFRVSACPGYHGESMVLRILRPESVRIGLANLGFQPDHLDAFNRTIRRPNGIFLVTGPTGSGKTTTLYTALDVLNRPDKKIITAEDPVEYNFTGINQCQVREGIGLSFARILRAMLRQAPNVILVGEIRDKDVAEVATQAALTGHLVFSTLHTNDAPSAITRLIDMGVKPFLVASSIQAVMAQRLIRVLCDDCKVPDREPNRYHMKLIGIQPADLKDQTIFKANGCSACNHSGYRGRRAIFEFMEMNSEIRELAFKRAATAQIRQAAIAAGMRNLAGDGRLKVLSGLTSAEEVARVAQVEGLVGADEEEVEVAT
jgi:type IV pilus assembly protein PilB